MDANGLSSAPMTTVRSCITPLKARCIRSRPAYLLGQGGPRPWPSSDHGLSPGDIDGVSRLYGRIPTRTTVTTNPAGLTIEVDREAYIAPHSFDWAPGSSHTIGVSSPQHDVYFHYEEISVNSDYRRYLFAKWSDGGSQSHSVTASPSTTVFIANFIAQIRPEPLAPNRRHGGTIRFDPPSADGFYTSFSFVKAIAEPAEGFSFERWGGVFDGERFGGGAIGGGDSTNPALLDVRQDHLASFTRQPLTTIDTDVPGSVVLVDGSGTKLPANFAWEPGSTHTLEVLFFDGSLQVFNGWSDGGDSTHDITVSGEPTTITASFTKQVSLDTGSALNGGGRSKDRTTGGPRAGAYLS